MAKGKAKIPLHLLGELSSENSKWFRAYEKSPKAPTTKSYRTKVERFLRYTKHNQKPFYTFIQDDVINFIEMLEKEGEYRGGGIDPYIGAISKCAEILRDEYPKKFSPFFLADISKLKKNEKSTPSGQALTSTQISYIRKYNTEHAEQDDFYGEYIFEMIFQLGLQLEELQLYQPKDYDREKQCFISAGGEPIPYQISVIDSLLIRFLDSAKDISNKHVDFSSESRKYFKEVTAYLKGKDVYSEGRNINSEYLKQSHTAYFIPCPNCKKETENIEENWVLTKVESSDVYRLYCKTCKGK